MPEGPNGEAGPPLHDPLRALVGTTASGKTELGIAVAERLGSARNVEIVSVDSMLVYRGMDIGTAKPTREQRARVPHHLLDLVDPQEPFSVAEFQRHGLVALREISARGAAPLLVGGSGLYFRALADRLEFPGTDAAVRAELETVASAVGPERLHERLAAFDPAAADRIDPANARRTVRALEVAAVTGRPFSSYATSWDRYPSSNARVAGIDLPAEILDDRVARRVDAMVAGGFVEEVEELVRRGVGAWLTSSQAIGYAEMTRHLNGSCTLDEAMEGTVRRTRVLARRQRAWFRRDPRVRWFEASDPASLPEEIARYLSDG
ncbi:MAG: tRNA (adenosine(37)-N6)-dimethylallyltransferase MiaA [Actinomycetota bacterium]